MASFDCKPTSYYTLDPHVETAENSSNYIPINQIATRVYGKPYNSLRGCQRDNENLPNDSVALYEFADEGDF